MNYCYDGYRVYNTDIYDLYYILSKLKKDYRKKAKHQISKLIRLLISARIDKKEKPEHIFKYLMDYYFDVIKPKYLKHIKSLYNFEASVMLYPIVDDHILIIELFGVDNLINFPNWIESQGQDAYFKSVHIQNYTDKPENISDKEWEYRNKLWNKIRQDDTTPASEFGFIFTIFTEVTMYNMWWNLVCKKMEPLGVWQFRYIEKKEEQYE